MPNTRALPISTRPRPWLALALTMCLAVAVTGNAATIAVNTTDDELDFIPNDRCSLREAVVTVNEQRASGVGGCFVVGVIGTDDTIIVPAGLFRLTRISPSSGLTPDQDFDNLNLRRNVTIRGAGAGSTVIDGEDIYYNASHGVQWHLQKGGVVHVESGVTATIEGVTIRRGEAYEGGGVYVAGDLTLRNAAVENNVGHRLGSGIRNAGSLTLDGVTIAGNGRVDEDAWPTTGGGIHTGGTLDALNTTVSGNEASMSAGVHVGVDAGLTILDSVTITDNHTTGSREFAPSVLYTGGVYGGPTGTLVRVQNSIIAGNRSPGDSKDCVGQFDSRDFNLVGQLGDCAGFSIFDLRGSADSPIDPVLSRLGNYGGPTRTHALLPGSPAVDAGPLPATGTCPATDQRGFPRGVDGDLNGFVHCDIGAYEGPEGLAAQANLQVFLSASPDPVAAGAPLTYNVSVRNHGPTGAAGVSYALTLPEGAGAVTRLPPGCTVGGGTVTCSVGAMDEFELISHLIDVTAPTTLGAVIAGATVTSASTDPEPSDDSVQTSTRIVSATSADLWLTMYAGAGVERGGTIEFVLVAGNFGPQAAGDDARVTNFLPESATFESATAGCNRVNNILTCPVGGLAPGATREFRILMTAPDQLVHVTNTASVTVAPGSDGDPSNNSATFTVRVVDPPPPTADLAITKTGPVTAQVGSQMTYNLIVRNDGPDAAEDVRITDELPAGTSPVTLPPACEATGQTVTCDVGALEPDSTNTYPLLVRAPDAEGVIENVATVEDRGGSFDPNPLEDEARAITTITAEPPPPGADLAISKSGPAAVRPGEEIRYSLVVANNGPDGAEGVIMTDTLPAGVTVTEVPPTCVEEASTVVCELEGMAPGTSATFTVRVTAPEGEGEITNTATVTSDTPDSVPTNDTDTVTTRVTAEAPVGEPLITVASHPDSAASATARPGDDGVLALRFTAEAEGDEAAILQGLTARTTGQSGGADHVTRISVYADTDDGPELLAIGVPVKVGGNDLVVLDFGASGASTVPPGVTKSYRVLVDVGTKAAGNPGSPLLALMAAALLPLGWARRGRARLALLLLLIVAVGLTSCRTATPEVTKPSFVVVLDTVTAVGEVSGAFAEVSGLPVTGTRVTVEGARGD